VVLIICDFLGNPIFLKATFGQSIHDQQFSKVQKYHNILIRRYFLYSVGSTPVKTPNPKAHIDASDSQLPFSEDYLYRDP